jgi:hypothetical protein
MASSYRGSLALSEQQNKGRAGDHSSHRCNDSIEDNVSYNLIRHHQSHDPVRCSCYWPTQGPTYGARYHPEAKPANVSPKDQCLKYPYYCPGHSRRYGKAQDLFKRVGQCSYHYPRKKARQHPPPGISNARSQNKPLCDTDQAG